MILLDLVFLFPVVINNVQREHWMWWIFPSSNYFIIFNHIIQTKGGSFKTSPMWHGVVWFVGMITNFFHICLMCIIWFNMDIFYWIFFLKILFYLCTLMMWILLHLPVICWFVMDSITCCIDIGSFLNTIRIHTLVP